MNRPMLKFILLSGLLAGSMAGLSACTAPKVALPEPPSPAETAAPAASANPAPRLSPPPPSAVPAKPSSQAPSPSASPLPETTPTPSPVPAPPAAEADRQSEDTDLPKQESAAEAVSWYYMKQEKGVVPRFPAETNAYKSEHRVLYVGTGKTVYLTIDVGSELGNKDKLLKTLREQDVKASFFITGANLKRNPDYIKELEQDGHLVLNHSITHRDFTTLSDEQVKAEFVEFEKLYTEITGKEPLKFFRFPYGKYSMHLLDVVSDLGYSTVFWSTAMRDWEPREHGADDAYNDIMSNLHDGNVILMHQYSQENIDAMERILTDIRKAGYAFGTVDELADHALPLSE